MNEAQVIEFDDKKIVVFDKFESELNTLLAENEKLVFDYRDTKGNKEACSHVYKFRKTRSRLDETRKDAKEKAVIYGRMVDGKANEIKAKIDKVIDRHDVRLAELKEEEDARKKAHEDNLLTLADYLKLGLETPSETIQEYLDYACEFPVDDSLEEYEKQAEVAKNVAIKELGKILEARLAYEAQQIELEKLKKESEEREAQEEADRITREARESAEREEQAAKERVESKRVADLRERLDAFTNYQSISRHADISVFKDELKKMQAHEVKDDDWQEFSDKAKLAQVNAINGIKEIIELIDKAAAQAKEVQILQDEKDERDRLDEEDRKKQAQEAQEDAEAKRQADNKAHQKKVNNVVAEALKNLGASEELAKDIVKAIAKKQIPHVGINY